MTDKDNAYIVWKTKRGKGHVFTTGINNTICSRKYRREKKQLSDYFYHVVLTPMRICHITCQNCKVTLDSYEGKGRRKL